MAAKQIQERIDYWQSKGLPKMRSTNSKVYKETIEKLVYLINGTHMFRATKNSLDDFKTSVDRWALMALDPNFLPYKKDSLRYTSLSSFLHDKFTSGPFQSRYIFCLNQTPVPRHASRYPEIYQTLAQSYIKTLNNGIKSFDDLTSQDCSNLGWTANKLGRFIKERGDKLSPMMTNTNQKIVTSFINASLHYIKHDLTRFSTHLLTRAWLWEKFPNYLDQKGFVTQQKQFSIYG